ncbi:MAG: DNA-directed RNA polymerase subunit P [archaeon]
MTEYKCFVCDKMVDESFLRKKIRCPYCGSKIVFKQRTTTTIVKAR